MAEVNNFAVEILPTIPSGIHRLRLANQRATAAIADITINQQPFRQVCLDAYSSLYVSLPVPARTWREGNTLVQQASMAVQVVFYPQLRATSCQAKLPREEIAWPEVTTVTTHWQASYSHST